MVQLIPVPHSATATLHSVNWVRVRRKVFKDGTCVYRFKLQFVHESDSGVYLEKITADAEADELALLLLKADVLGPLYVCMEPDVWSHFMHELHQTDIILL